MKETTGCKKGYCPFYVVGATRGTHNETCLFNIDGYCHNGLLKLFEAEREGYQFRKQSPLYNEPVIVGKYALSIQASSFHYSVPKEDLRDLLKYEAFELAILSKEKEENGENFWVDIKADKFIKRVLNEYGLMEYWDRTDVYPVFAYVPMHLIKTLYTKLYKETIK